MWDDATPVEPPSAEFDRRTHQRLLASDPVAPEELAEAYLRYLAYRLARQYPNVDDDLIETAVTDAILSYAERPTRYNPTLASLAGYLLMSAAGDLKNALRRTSRQTQFESPLEAADVELEEIPGNIEVQGRQEPAIEPDGLPENISWKALRERVNKEIPDRLDRQILELMLAGERKTEVYAGLLGLESLPLEEQRRLVKQTKDRLQKRLERLKKDFNAPPE